MPRPVFAGDKCNKSRRERFLLLLGSAYRSAWGPLLQGAGGLSSPRAREADTLFSCRRFNWLSTLNLNKSRRAFCQNSPLQSARKDALGFEPRRPRSILGARTQLPALRGFLWLFRPRRTAPDTTGFEAAPFGLFGGLHTFASSGRWLGSLSSSALALRPAQARSAAVTTSSLAAHAAGAQPRREVERQVAFAERPRKPFAGPPRCLVDSPTLRPGLREPGRSLHVPPVVVGGKPLAIWLATPVLLRWAQEVCPRPLRTPRSEWMPG